VTDAKQSPEDSAPKVEAPAPSSTPHHDAKPTVRRLLIVLALLAVGAVTFGWARKVLPPEQLIGDPQSYNIQIQYKGPTAEAPAEFLTFDQLSGGLVEIQSSVIVNKLPIGNFTSGSPDQSFTIETQLELPGSGIEWTQCPESDGCSIVRNAAGNETIIRFLPSLLDQSQNVRLYTPMTAVIRDASLAFTYDRESANVEMPYVSVKYRPTSSGSYLPLVLFFNYSVPHASDFQ
jgi:hypothetical protein